MCGFVGLFGFNELSIEILKKMGSSMKHRGPDDNDIFIDHSKKIALAHQRLSILDLSKAGHQPMKSRSGRYIIVFNGEFYNHLDIRKYIETKFINQNIKWKGYSDTETLIECIDLLGLDETLQKVEGMFSFALFDNSNGILTLARDRMGEKPLYYGYNNGLFYFGSELKSFKSNPKFKPKIDQNSLSCLIKYNFIPAPLSIYENIFKLSPGKTISLNLDSNELIEKSYWNIYEKINLEQKNISDSDYINNLNNLLKKTVAKQMISDVPLGSFLSGGIDSSTITALMQENSIKKIQSFTIGFDDFNYNEAIHAKKIANSIGTDHNELYLSSKDAINVIPNLSSVYDEPFADSSQIPTYLVSKMAKNKITVALTGDGGDELFGGYNRYVLGKRMWAKISHFPYGIRKIFSKLISSVSPESYNLFFNNFFKLLPISSTYNNLGDKLHKGSRVMLAKNSEELYEYFISHWMDVNEVVRNRNNRSLTNISFNKEIDSNDLIFKMMLTDLTAYLPDDILCKVDRAAMANSLETRLPMLDHNVVELALQIPMNLKLKNKVGKWILREILYKYVPKDLVERPKMGFGIPLGSWLRGPLKDWAGDLLSQNTIKNQNYLEYGPIDQCWKEHLSGKHNWSTSLWSILMFQEWLSNQ